jgi:hypothetical protein
MQQHAHSCCSCFGRGARMMLPARYLRKFVQLSLLVLAAIFITEPGRVAELDKLPNNLSPAPHTLSMSCRDMKSRNLLQPCTSRQHGLCCICGSTCSIYGCWGAYLCVLAT